MADTLVMECLEKAGPDDAAEVARFRYFLRLVHRAPHPDTHDLPDWTKISARQGQWVRDYVGTT